VVVFVGANSFAQSRLNYIRRPNEFGPTTNFFQTGRGNETWNVEDSIMTADNDHTDNDRFPVNTREEVSETSIRLIKKASRSINILLYDYDEVLLPGSKIDDLLSTFIRQHERCRFQYLCSENDILHERGGKLILLARKFSTFIKLRQLPDDLQSIQEQFIVIDGNTSMITQDHRSYDYYARFNDRARAHKLNNRFEELWQRSEPVPGIHVTGL